MRNKERAFDRTTAGREQTHIFLPSLRDTKEVLKPARCRKRPGRSRTIRLRRKNGFPIILLAFLSLFVMGWTRRCGFALRVREDGLFDICCEGEGISRGRIARGRTGRSLVRRGGQGGVGSYVSLCGAFELLLISFLLLAASDFGYIRLCAWTTGDKKSELVLEKTRQGSLQFLLNTSYFTIFLSHEKQTSNSDVKTA